HDELDGDALAMEEGADGLEKIATTDHTQQLPPGTAIGMAIGAEIAPSHPTPICTVGVGAEMGGGVHLASPPPRGRDARWWGAGCLWAEVAGVLAVVAGRLGDEARKGGGLMRALGPRGWGLRCCRAHGGGVARPRPLEHEAQPHQGDEYQLVKKEMR